MARQADGRILVAGRSTAAGAVVARLRATGALDPDFGGDGRVTLPGGGQRECRARAAGRPDRRRGQRERQRDDDRRRACSQRLARHDVRRRRHRDDRLRLARRPRPRRGAAAGRQDRRRRLHAGRRGRRGRAPQRRRLSRHDVRRRREGDRRLRRRDVRQRGCAPAPTAGSSSPASGPAATTSRWRACWAEHMRAVRAGRHGGRTRPPAAPPPEPEESRCPTHGSS